MLCDIVTQHHLESPVPPVLKLTLLLVSFQYWHQVNKQSSPLCQCRTAKSQVHAEYFTLMHNQGGSFLWAMQFQMKSVHSLINDESYSHSQRPRAFWSAPGIETSGRSQFLSMRRVLALCFSANQICHILQWVRESWTSSFGGDQRSRFLVQTRRITASGEENVMRVRTLKLHLKRLWLYSSDKLFHHCLYLIICHVFRVWNGISNGYSMGCWCWIDPHSAVHPHCALKGEVLSKTF